MTYTYNLSGALIEETYPSGRVVKNTLDNDGSLNQVQSKRSGATYLNYANGFTYNAAGAVEKMRLGNGLWETTQFNSRLQPTQIGLGQGSTTPNKLKLDYEYGATASVNNGNITKQTITVPGVAHPFVQAYTYDSLNRINSAEETSNAVQTWKQAYVFDRYGNRAFDESQTTTIEKNCGTSPNFVVCTPDIPVINPTASTSTNRLNGTTYDAAGNVIEDAEGRQFTYDAENKQTEVRDQYNSVIGQYFFDGNGKRVMKIVPSTGEVTVFVYDAMGTLIAEYSSQLSEDQNVNYITSDYLGSPRIKTDRYGAVISRNDYLPYGEDLYTAERSESLGYSTDNIRQKFTGYERDNETDLDFAQARYYSGQLGRFTGVDPIFLTLARVVDPQQLNRYIYVRNNPLKYVDLSGLDLKLKAGMKKADVERIIKIYAKQYQKASGRDAIDRFEKSSVPITVGSGELPTRVIKDGTKTILNERYGETSRTGTGQFDDNGKLKSVALDSVTVIYDFNKRDNAQSRSLMDPRFPPPDSEQRVGNHETGHTEALITDAVKEISRTEEESEKYANDFADKIEKEKETLKYDEAQKKVREFFGYDNYVFSDKTKNKKPT